MSCTVRIQLPYHLRNLAQVGAEVTIGLNEPVTIQSLLDALEAAHPVLRGTIREYGTLKRRPWIRVFACGVDISFEPLDAQLPIAITNGAEPLMIVGAIAGG